MHGGGAGAGLDFANRAEHRPDLGVRAEMFADDKDGRIQVAVKQRRMYCIAIQLGGPHERYDIPIVVGEEQERVPATSRRCAVG